MMADRIFLHLSERWAVGADSQQWIVMKRRKDCGRGPWSAIAFVGSNKRVLMRVLGEKGTEITPEARTALNRLPNTFRKWVNGRAPKQAGDDNVVPFSRRRQNSVPYTRSMATGGGDAA